MTTMHNHAGGDVALAEDRLNITDPFFVFAEFICIDFDMPAWQLRHHVDKGAMFLNTPSLCQLILRHKTVEGLLTILIIVEVNICSQHNSLSATLLFSRILLRTSQQVYCDKAH